MDGVWQMIELQQEIIITAKMGGSQRIFTQRSIGDIPPDGDGSIPEMDHAGWRSDGPLGMSGQNGQDQQRDREQRRYNM